MRALRSTAAVAAFTALAAVAGCSSGGSAAAGTDVDINALWYGKQASGEILGGVTPVVVTSSRTDSTSFAVDLSDLKDAGAGDVWNAAAWSAATIGTLGAAKNPQGLQVGFELSEEIDGPSAGGLMTTGVLASLTGATVRDDATMTGTILPNGGIGPVGGIPEKIRAAASAGLKQVLIPAGQTMSVDPQTGRKVDVVELGSGLGVEVKEIDTVRQAYNTLAEDGSPLPQSEPGPVSSPVLAVEKSATDEAMQQLAALGQPAPAPRPAMKNAHAAVAKARTDALAQVPEMISKGLATAAYARATEAVRMVLAWNARAAAVSAASSDMAAATSDLTAKANAVAEQAAAKSAAGASSPLAHTEQAAALAEALTWAADAQADTQASAARLGSGMVATAAAIGQVAAEVASSEYDLSSPLATSIAAALASGAEPVGDTTALMANATTYASFLSSAAEANLNYFRVAAQKASVTPDSTEVQRGEQAGAIVKSYSQATGTPQPALSQLAMAVSYFVSSVALVAELGVIASVDGAEDAKSVYSIANDQEFARQVAISVTESDASASALAALSADPSYFRWTQAWAEATALAPDQTGATDQIRRDGLAQQWFSIVASKIAIEQVSL